VEPFGDGAVADLGHARLVVGVRAGEGQVDLPDGQADGGGLPVEEFLAKAVDGDAAEFFVDGGEQGDDLVLGLLAQEVKRPGAVLASAPTEQDALWGTAWPVVVYRLHPTPTPWYLGPKVSNRKDLSRDTPVNRVTSKPSGII
jgi:hypothetical protein